MPQPLSQDLRARIVRAVEDGSSARQAEVRFDVSPSTAVKLMQRYRALRVARRLGRSAGIDVRFWRDTRTCCGR